LQLFHPPPTMVLSAPQIAKGIALGIVAGLMVIS
jgi:hypothetical protein